MHGEGNVITDRNSLSVRSCACGVVHLGFGAVTVNLSADMVRELAFALGKVASESTIHDSAGDLVFGNFQRQ